MKNKKITYVTQQENTYPQRLRGIPDEPKGLYVIGELPPEDKPSIAMIGARECSEYGRAMAREFASCMARAGVSVVSGMAKGIDSIAQKAALEAGGKTYAVLGCGADICYPASSRMLYDQICQERGGIISLCEPGTPPAKYLFPVRNRIVAGLADAVLVIEARQKSGTFITVDMALAQGKDVYAVPGRLTDRLSDGCNYLIRQGAGIALTPEDLLKELFMMEVLPAGSKDERTGVMKIMDYEPVHVDVLAKKMQMQDPSFSLAEMMKELTQLCLDGKVRQIGGSYFSLSGSPRMENNRA